MSNTEAMASDDALIERFFDEANYFAFSPDLVFRCPAGDAVLAVSPERRAAMAVRVGAARHDALSSTGGAWQARKWCIADPMTRFRVASALYWGLLESAPRFSHDQVAALLRALAAAHSANLTSVPYIVPLVVATERHVKENGWDENLDAAIRTAASRLEEAGSVEERRLGRRLRGLVSASHEPVLRPGEAWSDRVIADVDGADWERRKLWRELFHFCKDVHGSAPSARWRKEAARYLDAVGRREFADRLVEWLPLVDKPRTVPLARHAGYTPSEFFILDLHLEVLKALCWMATMVPNADLARVLGRLALSAYRKIPGIGPRAVKVGNAAVYALGQMPGRDALGQLAMLRVKVKFGTAQKGIEKALAAAAAREGLPREEIDELGVPSYGLTDVGVRREEMGEFTAELVVTGIGETELRFIRRAVEGGSAKPGKAQKSVPAALKASHAEELKELKAAAKDIGAMLPAQRDRIDSLFLEDKSWAMGVWRERYLDHPLVGVLARRLIWRVSDGKGEMWRSVTWLDGAGALVDVRGEPAAIEADSAIVRLWHPIDVDRDEVLAWRRFFEEREIRQPFKQAHREVYLLTDAERRTETYSNRYAAHVLRQHQFNALCGVRGWKNKLRLMVDDEYPPAGRRLPAWGVRAEFWIEGVGEGYGQDTTESGAYLHLTTDQVRFYRIDAASVTAHAGGGGYGRRWGGEAQPGVRLEEIPPLVFSEIMRDVDLFVGVASVGNNPEWQDGGPHGAYRDYWWGYSFGDLTESGRTRHDVLARLLPRLKIGAVCTLGEKFLSVKGKLRTYKIHLGSGNILMEPDDQYLCIVPSGLGEGVGGNGRVFLPFEGDRTLSIILSKAFMLAGDDQIKDVSITRQIGGR